MVLIILQQEENAKYLNDIFKRFANVYEKVLADSHSGYLVGSKVSKSL